MKQMTSQDVLRALGFSRPSWRAVVSPFIRLSTAPKSPGSPKRRSEVSGVIARAQSAFRTWREVPAPRRGELVRLLGEELRAAKSELGALVTLEAGKIVSEGLGEVREMIDICYFAVGSLTPDLSADDRIGAARTSDGRGVASDGALRRDFGVQLPCCGLDVERRAGACLRGDPVIWKPSEKTPLSALASMKILERALRRFGADAPEGLAQIVIGGTMIGEALVASNDVPIVSATGSTRLGAIVGPKVAARFGRPILELGGNNAMIVAPSANPDMAVRAIVFSAVGAAGQRCTSLRRLIVHKSIRAELTERLKKAYATLPIGDQRDASTFVGPLIDHRARERMLAALTRASAEGGVVHLEVAPFFAEASSTAPLKALLGSRLPDRLLSHRLLYRAFARGRLGHNLASRLLGRSLLRRAFARRCLRRNVVGRLLSRTFWRCLLGCRFRHFDESPLRSHPSAQRMRDHGADGDSPSVFTSASYAGN
jgi:aldehyde dehydrogenase (NAD+)